ncbi:MAG TPA: hypothetical protein VIE37_01475, partial [Methylomirabilota bacterium]
LKGLVRASESSKVHPAIPEGVAEEMRVQAAADAVAHALAEEHHHLLGDAPPSAHEQGLLGSEAAAGGRSASSAAWATACSGTTRSLLPLPCTMRLEPAGEAVQLDEAAAHRVDAPAPGGHVGLVVVE